jgi:hypothetical protein
MTLNPKTINDYLTLWEILDDETKKLFRPIMHKVKRLSGRFLVRTANGLMWAEWLIKPPVCISALCYRYLVLMILPVSESKMDLVLFERYEKHLFTFANEGLKEKCWYDDIQTLFPDYRLRLLLEPDSGDENANRYLTIISEVAHFPLNTKLTAKVVAKTIATVALNIHNEQTAAALECRNQRNNILAKGCQATCLDTVTFTK